MHLLIKTIKVLAFIIPLSVIGYFLLPEVGLPVVVLGANQIITEAETWNITSQTKDGKESFGISAGQINYMDNGVWKPIDTKLTLTANGFEMISAPFEFIAPLRSTGVATFRNDNEYDIFTKQTINESPFDKQITAIGVNDVLGQIVVSDLMTMNGLRKNVEYVLYPGAYNDADLIYYVDFGVTPKLSQLVRWNTPPTCSLPITKSFAWQYSDDVEIESFDSQLKKVKWPENAELNLSSNLRKNSLSVRKTGSVRGIGHFPFRIWDSMNFMETAQMNRNIRQIDVSLISTGVNRFNFAKKIPCDFFTGATYPVYTDETFNPDANPESTSVDGQTHIASCADCAWNTIRNTAGDCALPTCTTMRTGHTSTAVSNAYDTNVRSAILFDTSTLADTFVVGSATIKLVGDTKVTGGGCSADSYRVSTSSPASNTDLVSGDYAQKFGFTSLANADVAYADVEADGSTVETWTLNATGRDNISVTGISKFGAVGVFDATASEPGCTSASQNRVNWQTADGTTKPLLTVTAAAGAAAGVNEEEGIIPSFIYLFLNTAYAWF